MDGGPRGALGLCSSRGRELVQGLRAVGRETGAGVRAELQAVLRARSWCFVLLRKPVVREKGNVQGRSPSDLGEEYSCGVRRVWTHLGRCSGEIRKRGRGTKDEMVAGRVERGACSA